MVSTAQQADQLDRVFKALSDRTRRAVLARLATGPAKVTEIAAPFDMSLPAVSKHLKVLEKAGFIVRTVDGRVHQCAIGTEPLREVESWLSHYRVFWESKLDALAQYAEEGP